MAVKNRYDLQERLIDYSVRIITLAASLPASVVGKHIGKQILKSGTSPAPNYGEAQAAESRADFIHKLKIALKELRETEIWLKIIVRANVLEDQTHVIALIAETDELIAIIYKSITTAQKNKQNT
ncbi:four helix bundle protein [bacterium]|nr:four helix bundle protein [bacterium]